MPSKTKNRLSSSENRPSEAAQSSAWGRNRTILAAAGAAAVGAGAALFAWRRRNGEEKEQPAPAHSRKKTAPGPVGKSGAARSAGPAAMRDPPREWDREDEASDESFPASDPPPAQSKID